jgi:TRAP-type mannitol/chloroaromatic compound transport system substrate-binding protein
MKRREFLKKAGVGAVAASAVFGPVYAQALPRIRWRMSSGMTRALDITFGPRSGAEFIARRIGELTEGRLEISTHPAGELVPMPGLFDAVRGGAVEMGHLWSGWYFGISPVVAFDSGLPFGMGARQKDAWLLHGGGLELMRPFYTDHNMINFIIGHAPLPMGGWFRREIRGPEDLRGLRVRIPGMGGMVYARLGATPMLIPAGEIFLAMERGVVDAAEFASVHDDERLGLHRAARFYYYPGWHEMVNTMTLVVNLERWRALPRPYQEAIAAACGEASSRLIAEFDTKNTLSMLRLTRFGTQFRRFPTSVLRAAHTASMEVLEDLAARDAAFRAIYTPYKAFLHNQRRWFASNEFAIEDFVRTLPLPRPT